MSLVRANWYVSVSPTAWICALYSSIVSESFRVWIALKYPLSWSKFFQIPADKCCDSSLKWATTHYYQFNSSSLSLICDIIHSELLISWLNKAYIYTYTHTASAINFRRRMSKNIDRREMYACVNYIQCHARKPVRQCISRRSRSRRRSSRWSGVRNRTVLKQDETASIRLAGASLASLDPAGRKLTDIMTRGGGWLWKRERWRDWYQDETEGQLLALC